MNKKTSVLKIREKATGVSITIPVNSKNINDVFHLINWIKTNKHGKVIHPTLPYVVECISKNDFVACRLKAKKLNLIQTRIRKDTE